MHKFQNNNGSFNHQDCTNLNIFKVLQERINLKKETVISNQQECRIFFEEEKKIPEYNSHFQSSPRIVIFNQENCSKFSKLFDLH